jgi:SepF-like predicted cell division protein (DUF552 family)
MGFFSNLKDKFKMGEDEAEGKEEEDYVELSSEQESQPDAKIVVKPFNLEDFDDIKPVLDDLREGYTIPLINIRPLKEKDLVELRRAISKLKKTTEAMNGDIAGFGEDWIVVTPSFAKIFRTGQVAEVKGEEATVGRHQVQKY